MMATEKHLTTTLEQQPKVLPVRYQWLLNEGMPNELNEALRHYGLLEKVAGTIHPDLNRWCKEMNVDGWFPKNDFPWCGLFRAIVAKRCGWSVPQDFLAAYKWLYWGKIIPASHAMLWDTLIFERPAGHHVGWYVGENQHSFLVYGGNQTNAVGFAGIAKNRLIGVRRAPWRFQQPNNVRKIILQENFTISTNEQ